MFKWTVLNYILIGCPWHVRHFFRNRRTIQSRLQEVLKIGKEKYGKYILSSCCKVSLALKIILWKGVKGFLIKQKAIYDQISFLKCNSTANSHGLSYKCEEDHHSNYGLNFGSCEKKHKIFREWNLCRDLCDADNQLFSQEPTGRGVTIVFTCFIYFRDSDSCLQPTTLWGRNTIFRFSGRFSFRKQ